MNFDDMRKVKKEKDDVKTAAEHAEIILRYQQTGYLDRDDAVEKYRKFNNDHKDYWSAMTTTTLVTGASIDIRDAPDGVIIDNLNRQLFFLTGKNLLGNM